MPANRLLEGSRGVYLGPRCSPQNRSGSLPHDGPHLAMRLGHAHPADSVLCSHGLKEEASDPTGVASSNPNRTAGCVCLLMAPLWCDLGCCAQTVVVLKLWRTPPLHTLATAPAPGAPTRRRKLSLGTGMKVCSLSPLLHKSLLSVQVAEWYVHKIYATEL